jgi:ElaB/YqjD/DUF883 family membrane-anchored ribosome-binding protein
MERVANDHDLRHRARTYRRAARETVSAQREAIHQEVERLMADVEELIRRVGNATDPELARLRAKVEGALDTTKAALSENTEQLQRQARNAFAAGDRYVHDQAWQVIGVAAGAALAVGFLLGRR